MILNKSIKDIVYYKRKDLLEMKNKLLFGWVICLSIFAIMSNCYAEYYDFSYRIDIRFGDDMETVIEKDSMVGGVMRRDNYLRSYTFALSGIENSYINYYFYDNKLIEIGLLYGDVDLDDAIKNYDVINDGLKRKYGQPVENIENIKTYQDGAIEKYNKYGENDESINNKNLNAKNQWIIDVGEGNTVVIEHILFNYVYRNEMRSYHSVTYQYIDANVKITDYIDRDL